MASTSDMQFCQMMRASGLAEPWTHMHEGSKFDEFGWRCTTKESGFGLSTLVGNYNEDRYDLKYRLQSKPLPSQYNHYFTTTYGVDYNSKAPSVHPDAKGLKRYHPRAFPGHQPELDSASAKAVYNDWNTSSTAAYKPFNVTPKRPATQTVEQKDTQQDQWKTSTQTTPIMHVGARAGHSAPGGHVIAPPHSAPGAGAGAQSKSFRSTIGY